MGRLWRAVKQWAIQFGADLRASTDASLLSVARFFGLLYGPIDTKLPINQALRKSLDYRLPPHAGWRHALGGIAYLLFLLMVGSGVLLAVYYRPSAQEAYPSIQQIVSEVRFGWLIRAVHVWGANLLVIAVLVHMARVFFAAAYKPPRETNWLIGVLLLFLVLSFGATGYLLPWDQTAYWTVTEALEVLAGFPVAGNLAVALLRGDPIVSGATLSRFFAAHVIVLPWIALALLVFHFTLLRKHGVAPPVPAPGQPQPAGGAGGRRFFPNHLLRSFMVATLVFAFVMTAAVLWPRPVGNPADPSRPPTCIGSTWVVVDVSRALIHYLGGWGFTAFTLLGLSLALVPLFDRDPERRLRQRRFVAALGLVFFVGFLAAWVAGRGLRSAPPIRILERQQPPAAPPAQPAPGPTLPDRRRGPP